MWISLFTNNSSVRDGLFWVKKLDSVSKRTVPIDIDKKVKKSKNGKENRPIFRERMIECKII